MLPYPYLSQRSLEIGVITVEDATQRVVGLQLRADAQRRLEHAGVRVPALAVEAVLLPHRVQLQHHHAQHINTQQ